jgi:hypothetical protein
MSVIEFRHAQVFVELHTIVVDVGESPLGDNELED